MRTVLATLEDIKNIAKSQNNHFFDRSTLRFFNSRVSENVYPNLNGKKCWFVTSERFDDRSPRLYTVRVAELDEKGNLTLDTVSEFQEYGSRSGAHERARREQVALMSKELEEMQ